MKKVYLLIVFFFLLAVSVQSQDKKNATFSVIAFGDMPYFLPEDYKRFENLIEAVNEEHPSFSVHVGDIKSSSTKCTEEYYQKIYYYFEQFNEPLIYTPGDNEWTDCNKEAAGAYDPEERLEVLRKFFFKDSKSFGKEKLILTAQSQNPVYSKYVENKRWVLNNIAFATVHLVGTNNNFLPESKNDNKEFYDRTTANIAWLREVFSLAKQNNNPGIVLFTQADMFNADKQSSGFVSILKELTALTIDYAKPVLLVNGDSHKYIVDKPLLREVETKKVLENFTRLQVFGEQDMHAVKITIEPDEPSLFLIRQVLIKGN